jgi:FkbM family methyltransferase
LDIVRVSKCQLHSLLGIRNLPIKTIIDVGANKGQFARYISTLFPEAYIYCFEPLPEPYKELNKWAEKQRNVKVKTFNLALGDSEEVLRMFSHIEHRTSSSFLRTTKICENLYPFTQKQLSIPVRLTTLDNWIKKLPNPPALEILIKLDVQGYEDRVIKGGQEIFSMAKACILEVCLDQLYEGQATFKDISLLLYDLGYYYAGNLNQNYADDGHVISIDAVFMK